MQGYLLQYTQIIYHINLNTVNSAISNEDARDDIIDIYYVGIHLEKGERK